MKDYKVSVVTVCYNSANEIEKTMQSVFSQDYHNIEYIIIDGDSNDGTVDVIKKYASRISKWISEPDKGIYDAMNKGIEIATGDWIIFLNAGDYYHSNDVFSRFINEISDDTTIAYGLIHYFTPESEFDMEYIPIEQMEYLDPIPHPATMTKLCYHKNHLFDISFRSSGDYDFFYKAYYDDQVKFQFIPLIMTNFDNSKGVSKDNKSMIWKENKRVWSKHATFRLKIQMFQKQVFSIIKRFVKNVIYSNYRFL